MRALKPLAGAWMPAHRGVDYNVVYHVGAEVGNGGTRAEVGEG